MPEGSLKMIRLIESENEFDKTLLIRSLYGKKMLSYLKAYGTGYNFCKFYKIDNATGTGFMFMINSTLIICSEKEMRSDSELDLFVKMNLPFRIEGSQNILQSLDISEIYQPLNRTVFEIVSDGTGLEFRDCEVDLDPNLTQVYDILNEGFPNIADFSLWYTDTSHRCRHGISRVMTYKNCTTATISYDINNEVLISQVATRVSARGSGYARDFLKWLALFLGDLGKRAYLYALDVRVSFYREIGFIETDHETVLERKDIEKESMTKGKLEDE